MNIVSLTFPYLIASVLIRETVKNNWSNFETLAKNVGLERHCNLSKVILQAVNLRISHKAKKNMGN